MSTKKAATAVHPPRSPRGPGAKSVRISEPYQAPAAAAKAQSEAEAASAAAAEEDVLAQIEEEEIESQIREQQMRLEEIRRLRQKSQSQQIKILNEKGKEANEASKRHAAAVEATAKAKDALDSTTLSMHAKGHAHT